MASNALPKTSANTTNPIAIALNVQPPDAMSLSRQNLIEAARIGPLKCVLKPIANRLAV